MKLIIKNIKQVVHDLVIPDEKNNMSIKELKEEIQKSFGFDASSLKLLFNGIVLKDEKNLSDYKIIDNSIIIMMATKGHIINQNQSNNETNKENKKTENEKKKDKNNKNNNKKQKTEEKKKIEKDYSKEINQLMEMGFEKEKCQKAIKIAKGNVQIAIDLIYSGLPEEDIPDDFDNDDLFDNQNDYDNLYENYDNNNNNDDDDDDNNNNDQTTLQKLASVIKVLCHNEPNNLSEILGTIQDSAPEYFDLIQENEEEFKNLIKEPINENDLRNFRDFQSENDIFDNISGSNNNNNEDINITKEEMDVVKRLQEFGNCSEMDAYQAYVACEKNENLAINFILENKFGHDSMNIDGKNLYNILYYYIYSFKK